MTDQDMTVIDIKLGNAPEPTLAAFTGFALQLTASFFPIVERWGHEVTPETIRPLLAEMEEEYVERLAVLFVYVAKAAQAYAEEVLLDLSRRDLTRDS